MNSKIINDSIIQAIYDKNPVEALNIIKQNGIQCLNSRMNSKIINDSIIKAIYDKNPVDALNIIKQNGIQCLSSKSIVEILIFADLDILKYCVEESAKNGYQIFRQHSLSYLTYSNNIESFKYMYSLGIFTLDSHVLEEAIFRNNIELVKYIHQELKIEIDDDIYLEYINNFDIFKYVVDVFAEQNKLYPDLVIKLFAKDESFKFVNYYLEKVYSSFLHSETSETEEKIFKDYIIDNMLKSILIFVDKYEDLNLMKYIGLRRFLMNDAKHIICASKFAKIQTKVDSFKKELEMIEQSIKESTKIIDDVVKYEIMIYF